MSGKSQIAVLQAGRALAAIAVVFSHASLAVAYDHSDMPNWAKLVTEQGALGVDFFFVLSGFIISYSTNRHGRRFEDLKRFVKARLIRIYFPYLLVGISVAVGYSLFPGLSNSERGWGWWATLTLLPSEQATALAVAWTLRHEVVFYIVFAVAYYSGRSAIGLFLWFMSISLYALSGYRSGTFDIVFGLINLEFFMGAGVFVILYRNIRISNAVLLTAALMALVAYALLGFDVKYRLLAGLMFACTLVPIVRAEIVGRVEVPLWLMYLGAASYAIYLVHDPFLAVFSRVLRFFDFSGAIWWLDFTILVIAGIFVGCLYYNIVERPVLGILRQRPPTAS